MAELSPILNPSTGQRFPRRRINAAPLIGQVCLIGLESQVPATIGAFTVLAPAAPNDGELFAVTDIDGGAGANTITVSGNGHNINDAATATLTFAFRSLVFVFDAFDNQWHKLVYARDVTDPVDTTIFVQDVSDLLPPVPPAGLVAPTYQKLTAFTGVAVDPTFTPIVDGPITITVGASGKVWLFAHVSGVADVGVAATPRLRITIDDVIAPYAESNYLGTFGAPYSSQSGVEMTLICVAEGLAPGPHTFLLVASWSGAMAFTIDPVGSPARQTAWIMGIPL